MNTYSPRSIPPRRSCLLAATLLLAGTFGASATLVVNLTFDGDGKSDGQSLATTANSGSLGGFATGNHPAPDPNITPQYDLSTNPRNGLAAMTIQNGTSFQGNVSYALTDGAVAHDNDFTIAFALRLDSGAATFARPFEAPTMALNMQYTGSKLQVTAPGVNFDTQFGITQGVWTHLTLTYDHDGGSGGTPRVKLYKDGSLVGDDGSANNVMDIGDAQTLYLLSRGSPLQRTWSGAIDNFQVHNAVLGAAAIRALSDASLLPEPGTVVLMLLGGGLLAYWRRRS